MKINSNFIAILAFTAGINIFSSCSRSPEARRQNTEISNQQNRLVADQEDASYVTELEFSRGLAALNSNEINKINNLISRALNIGEIDEIKVISWADQEYPSKNVKVLPRDQRDLATLRNREIKSQIEGINTNINVATYNMAERPGALAELFKTKNARIKQNLELAGIPNTGSKIMVPSKASKAVVMVIMKE